MSPLPISKQQYTPLNHSLNNLLIEAWSTNINYSGYLARCAPKSCTYAKTDRTNFSYTITLLLGVYGGLIIILRLFTTYFAKILWKCKLLSINTNAATGILLLSRTILSHMSCNQYFVLYSAQRNMRPKICFVGETFERVQISQSSNSKRSSTAENHHAFLFNFARKYESLPLEIV